MKCSFGCGKEAYYLVSGEQPCCSSVESACPAIVDKFKKLIDRELVERDGLNIKITNVAGFRSSPDLRTGNDMVQVTATMSKITFKRLKKHLNINYIEK